VGELVEPFVLTLELQGLACREDVVDADDQAQDAPGLPNQVQLFDKSFRRLEIEYDDEKAPASDARPAQDATVGPHRDVPGVGVDVANVEVQPCCDKSGRQKDARNHL
jgi:hypothetical protein